MSQLRDVFFIPCPGDIEVRTRAVYCTMHACPVAICGAQVVKNGLRARLKAKGMSADAVEAELERKEREEYKYFIRRVRRVIPQPKQLHREFADLVQLYCDVFDNKTGKKFFNKAGWKIYNCVVHPLP